MAEHTYHEETTSKAVWTLSSPTNWAEIGKVFASVKQRFADRDTSWDDFVTVEARDDEIIFWVDITTRVTDAPS